MYILSYNHLLHIKRHLTTEMPDVLVETGTYRGDTLDELELCFCRLLSIEASPQLYEQCRKRFQRSPKITLLLGDSATLLSTVIQKLACPLLFYLDAHYWFHPAHKSVIYKGNKQPLYEEIDAVCRYQSHRSILVIDDVRCFGRSDRDTQVYWEDITVDGVLARLDRVSKVSVHDDKLFILRDPAPDDAR